MSSHVERLGRKLEIGDVVLTKFFSVGVVADFTPKKVKLAAYRRPSPAFEPRVSVTSYEPHTLLTLSVADFAGTDWEGELAFVKQELEL